MKLRIFALCAASLVVGGIGSPATAKGCNGVVNQLVWGCAIWDNNNGPQYPYFKDPINNTISIPKDVARIRTQNGQQQVFHDGRWVRIISEAGGSIIGQQVGTMRRGQ